MPNPIHDARYKLFREMIIEARKDAKLKQAEVAERLGKNQSFVSKYERGERRLDLPEFVDVCEAIGIDVEKFLQIYKGKLNQ
nr:helix-turn-helix transcriptional regulator [uncultured Noviherbaspirillum sp.]